MRSAAARRRSSDCHAGRKAAEGRAEAGHESTAASRGVLDDGWRCVLRLLLLLLRVSLWGRADERSPLARRALPLAVPAMGEQC